MEKGEGQEEEQKGVEEVKQVEEVNQQAKMRSLAATLSLMRSLLTEVSERPGNKDGEQGPNK